MSFSKGVSGSTRSESKSHDEKKKLEKKDSHAASEGGTRTERASSLSTESALKETTESSHFKALLDDPPARARSKSMQTGLGRKRDSDIAEEEKSTKIRKVKIEKIHTNLSLKQSLLSLMEETLEKIESLVEIELESYLNMNEYLESLKTNDKTILNEYRNIQLNFNNFYPKDSDLLIKFSDYTKKIISLFKNRGEKFFFTDCSKMSLPDKANFKSYCLTLCIRSNKIAQEFIKILDEFKIINLEELDSYSSLIDGSENEIQKREQLLNEFWTDPKKFIRPFSEEILLNYPESFLNNLPSVALNEAGELKSFSPRELFEELNKRIQNATADPYDDDKFIIFAQFFPINKLEDLVDLINNLDDSIKKVDDVRVGNEPKINSKTLKYYYKGLMNNILSTRQECILIDLGDHGAKCYEEYSQNNKKINLNFLASDLLLFMLDEGRDICNQQKFSETEAKEFDVKRKYESKFKHIEEDRKIFQSKLKDLEENGKPRYSKVLDKKREEFLSEFHNKYNFSLLNEIKYALQENIFRTRFTGSILGTFFEFHGLMRKESVKMACMSALDCIKDNEASSGLYVLDVGGTEVNENQSFIENYLISLESKETEAYKWAKGYGLNNNSTPSFICNNPGNFLIAKFDPETFPEKNVKGVKWHSFSPSK